MKNRLAKVVIWRIVSILITLAVLLYTTGDVKSATSVTVFLHTFLTAGHYIFETIWESYENR